MLKNISYTEATEIMAAQPVELSTRRVPLTEALRQILAEDVHAAFPMPPFDRSPFDGFAVRAADLPGTLTIRGKSVTGCARCERLLPGTAMRIFTGAPIPEGADAVVKIEDTIVDGERVSIPLVFAPDTNVIHAGEDYPAGALLLKAGTKLNAAEVGVLASQGIGTVPVFKRPQAVIFSTGTELAEPGEQRAPYGIYNSSFYTLSAYLQCMDLDVRSGGIVVDDRALIERKLAAALESDADLVITTGGASIGDYDFAFRAAQDLGMEILFWKVNMKPGGALMAARSGKKCYIALSGNPAAAIMSVLVVLQPWLRRLSGSTLGNTELELPLLNPMPKFSTAARMLRGHEVVRDGRAYFCEHPGRGNSHIASFEHCDMIGVVPPGSGTLRAGDTIKVLRLPMDLCS